MKNKILMTNKMSHPYDNSVGTVNGPSCSYTTLSQYNNGARGMQVPVRNATENGVYIVPQFSAIGYNSLTYTPSCRGYPSIDTAYQSNGGNCNQQYIKKLVQ